MILKNLTLESFRSYGKLALPIGEGSHLFLGPNGGGKTNLIEAISCLSQTRSCLKANAEDLVRFGQDFLKVRADTVSDLGEEKNLEFVFQLSPVRSSAFFVNDVRVPVLEFIGLLPSITFLPQALSLFTGPPSDRRNFLDALMTQLRPGFAVQRMEFERVLKQRNALLKLIAQEKAHEADLDLWDERLSTIGSLIVSERNSVLEEMNENFLHYMQSLSEKYTSAVLEYRQTFLGDDAHAYQSALQHVRSKDIILQSTTVGPHRDDWRCIADGHDIAFFASRGQQRTALLGLLFVSAGLFRRARNEKPVILLDDVLSELDDAHQKALLSHFKDHQILITGTHAIDALPHMTTWNVGEGTVKKAD